MTTIKCTITNEWLDDKKEERDLEPRAGRSTNRDEDLQNSSVEKDHNT